MCQILYFNKAAGLYNFIKIETLAQGFSCEFCEISKNTFSTEHVWVTAPGIYIFLAILKKFKNYSQRILLIFQQAFFSDGGMVVLSF